MPLLCFFLFLLHRKGIKNYKNSTQNHSNTSIRKVCKCNYKIIVFPYDKQDCLDQELSKIQKLLYLFGFHNNQLGCAVSVPCVDFMERHKTL